MTGQLPDAVNVWIGDERSTTSIHSGMLCPVQTPHNFISASYPHYERLILTATREEKYLSLTLIIFIFIFIFIIFHEY